MNIALTQNNGLVISVHKTELIDDADDLNIVKNCLSIVLSETVPPEVISQIETIDIVINYYNYFSKHIYHEQFKNIIYFCENYYNNERLFDKAINSGITKSSTISICSVYDTIDDIHSVLNTIDANVIKSGSILKNDQYILVIDMDQKYAAQLCNHIVEYGTLINKQAINEHSVCIVKDVKQLLKEKVL